MVHLRMFSLWTEGGDVGFVRHTTIRENTDGRNQADWARNRRSDDYELLCNDGTRKDIDQWSECNLASIPNNAIVTAGSRSPLLQCQDKFKGEKSVFLY